MKLTFHFQKNEAVNERVAEDVSKYPQKNAMKLRKFPHFCWVRGDGVAIFTKKKKQLKSEMFNNKKS